MFGKEHLKMAVTIFFLLFSLASASKILILSCQEGSHIRAVSTTGRALAERGHQVTIPVLHSNKQGPEVIGKMEQLLFGDQNEKAPVSNTKEFSERFLSFYREKKVFESLHFTFFDYPFHQCRELLSDKKLYDTAKARNFDLILVDALITVRCFFIFAHSLGVPYVSQTAVYPFDIGIISKHMFNPFTTSLQFNVLGTYIPSDAGKQSVIERLSSVVSSYLLLGLAAYQKHLQYNTFKNYSWDRPLTKSLSQLAAESKIWLLEQSPILEFPRPMYGTFKFIGGMNWKPSKSLTGEYAKVVRAATNGFVVVSLGGDLLYMPTDLGDKIASVFEKIPEYTFIWANRGQLTKLPKNVMKVGWMPQNDLIGHKNCKLFVTHCGSNGQFEAVGHGVPMLGIPIHRDQPANAWRMVDRGFGLALTLNTVEVDEFVDKIKELIDNPKYKENIMKAKAVFHDLPRKPTEEAVYWVEHVLKHGGDYLHSEAMEMPWYKVLGYDVMVLFLLFVYISVKLMIWSGSKVMKALFNKTKAKKD